MLIWGKFNRQYRNCIYCKCLFRIDSELSNQSVKWPWRRQTSLSTWIYT